MKRKSYSQIDLFGSIVEQKKKGKICRVCGSFKSFVFFYKSSSSKDGYRGACKCCEKKQHKEIHSREHEIAKYKICGCCGILKDASKFAKDRTQTDGLHSHCKECQAEARMHNKTIRLIVKPKSRKRFANE